MDYYESLKRFHTLLESINEEDYRGRHQAPNQDEGAPLYDVTINGMYPDDVYGPNGIRYYGDRLGRIDRMNFEILHRYHNKPDAKIKIYRAIPKEISNAEKISGFEQDKKYILKTGKIPKHGKEQFPTMNKSEYYDYADKMIEKLKQQGSSETSKDSEIFEINVGDWVTITRSYAVQHGKSSLKGYRILSKVVRAKDIFTEGNSLSEWGYYPQQG